MINALCLLDIKLDALRYEYYSLLTFRSWSFFRCLSSSSSDLNLEAHSLQLKFASSGDDMNDYVTYLIYRFHQYSGYSSIFCSALILEWMITVYSITCLPLFRF